MHALHKIWQSVEYHSSYPGMLESPGEMPEVVGFAARKTLVKAERQPIVFADN